MKHKSNLRRSRFAKYRVEQNGDRIRAKIAICHEKSYSCLTVSNKDRKEPLEKAQKLDINIKVRDL